jgi:RNA polymerase sigma-70 factor (ECF subfamily)
MPVNEATASELIKSCLHTSSEEAWRQLVRQFQPLIASVVLRICRRHGSHYASLVDDLVQETFLRLCRDDSKVLRQFEFRHEAAVFGFIKVVAGSVANDHFRSLNTQKRAGEFAVEAEVLEQTAVAADSGAEKQMLFRQFEQYLQHAEVSERDRNVFWFYYRQGFTAVEIASLPGVELSAKGVESCLLRLVKVVRSAVQPKSPAVEGSRPSSTLGEVR